MARAREICFASGFMMGEVAAIALPPQMAVPTEIKKDKGLSILRNFPAKYPRIITEKILITVSIKPDFPASRASLNFIPNPKPTIDTCNNI
jgi:hypothetical protein